MFVKKRCNIFERGIVARGWLVRSGRCKSQVCEVWRWWYLLPSHHQLNSVHWQPFPIFAGGYGRNESVEFKMKWLEGKGNARTREWMRFSICQWWCHSIHPQNTFTAIGLGLAKSFRMKNSYAHIRLSSLPPTPLLHNVNANRWLTVEIERCQWLFWKNINLKIVYFRARNFSFRCHFRQFCDSIMTVETLMPSIRFSIILG